MASDFPQLIDTRAFRQDFDAWFNSLVADYGEFLERLFLPLLRFLQGFEDFLLWLPWYVVILALAGLGYLITRNWKIALGFVVMLFVIGAFIDLWEEAMETIALMLTATAIAVVIGIPVGIAMSRSDRLQSVVVPILDLMQTLPIYVYLIPFVMLLGAGKIPALLATIVFGIPPVIRLTNLGIRHVDKEIMEAVTAFGATPRQRLLSAQIPLALPTIMAGINQTTMMSLSMVVIASLIGAGGLGLQVLQGIQRLQIAQGLLAGLAIVFIAVIFDRMAQAYGRRMQAHLKLDS